MEVKEVKEVEGRRKADSSLRSSVTARFANRHRQHQCRLRANAKDGRVHPLRFSAGEIPGLKPIFGSKFLPLD
jgi:hypothetical protein